MALLEIKNLKKAYKSPGGVMLNVIDIPEFSLDKGEQIALHGTSGSGKTTFLNLVGGILQSGEGEINFLGQNLCQLSEAKRDEIRAKHIGYIFQSFNLLQGYTVFENVLMGLAFGAKGDVQYAKQLINELGLTSRLAYKTFQLSIGQQQRVAVARAVIKHPKLVLADEPTGNLDRKNALKAIKLIRNICHNNNTALILVSHDNEILDQFDKRQELSEINKHISNPELEELEK